MNRLTLPFKWNNGHIFMVFLVLNLFALITSIKGTPNELPFSYCYPSTGSGFYGYINRFTINSINNYSAWDDYGDYSGTVITLSQNVNYNFSINPSTTNYSRSYKVWVDFNKDMDFNDAGELLMSTSSTSSVGGIFNSGSAIGQLRIRIFMRYGGSIFDACSSYSYGDVEDYTLNIISCSDGIQNGAETGIDCGGSCQSCHCATLNHAIGKVASQSSNFSASYPASLAVDNNVTTFNHTAGELKPWLQVDLNAQVNLSKIEVVNRSGCSTCVTEQRLKNFTVFVSKTPITTTDINVLKNDPLVYKYSNTTVIQDGATVTINNVNFTGRYLRVWGEYATNNYLHLGEIRAFGVTNQTPVVSVSSAAHNTTIYVNSNITINATTSDTENAITKVEFYNGATLLGEDATAPFSWSITSLSLGTYNIKAKVIDNCGTVGNSPDSVLVNVIPLPTCTDGLQNGDETGIDCGGLNCIPCAQICTTLVNVALNKFARLNGTFAVGNLAEFAVDGNETNLAISTSAAAPYLDVDLRSPHTIESIEIFNRTDCCPERLSNFDIFISPKPFTTNVLATLLADTTIYDYYFPGTAGSKVITPSLLKTGRFIRLRLRGTNFLQVREIKIYGCPLTINYGQCYWEKIDSNLVYIQGNVGVGTDAPSHPLTVNGEIKAREFLASLNSWPDYVFDKKYPLKSLGELETYIQRYSRLPGMPSEKEVLEQGLEVGKFQIKLMEKIEELVLYMIEREKWLTKMEKQYENKSSKK